MRERPVVQVPGLYLETGFVSAGPRVGARCEDIHYALCVDFPPSRRLQTASETTIDTHGQLLVSQQVMEAPTFGIWELAKLRENGLAIALLDTTIDSSDELRASRLRGTISVWAMHNS